MHVYDIISKLARFFVFKEVFMKNVTLNDLINNVKNYNEPGVEQIEKAYYYAKTLMQNM